MKHVWANMLNRDSPAQPMKGNQLLMKGEQLLMKGDWALRPNQLCLGGWRWSGHPPGKQFPCLPSSWNMTILVHMAPEVASWNNQAENMVDPTI